MNDEIKDPPEELKFCVDCDKPFPDSTKFYTISDHEKEVCENCFLNYSECYECGDHYHTDTLEENREGYTICQSCLSDNYFHCDGCQEWIHNDDYAEDGYCQSCHDTEREESGDTSRRVDVGTNKFISKRGEYGTLVKSGRLFSSEIECYYPDYKNLIKVGKKMDRALGISTDGSLDSNGIEFQTPRLGGRKGEEFMRELCKTLLENKFTVNKRCGLHIHLDGGRKFLTKRIKDQQAEPVALKNLMLIYLQFDDVILSFLPPSRRNNRFCLPLSLNYTSEAIKECQTLDELEALWYKDGNKKQRESRKRQKYDNTRYSGINFHSLLGHNHLEIRFHNGTINCTKILLWTALNVRIMDTACNAKFDKKQLINMGVFRSLEEKTNFFFELLGIPANQRRYFLARQQKFMDDQTGQSEQDKEDSIVCAE